MRPSLPAHSSEVAEADVLAIAQAFHERYEWWAEHHGWRSQVGAIPWDAVPESNRETMLSVVRSLLDTDAIRVGDGLG